MDVRRRVARPMLAAYPPDEFEHSRTERPVSVPVTEARPRMAAAVGLRGPVGFTQVSGFRFVLELPDREPADPAMFNTALPPGMWKPGDAFLAAYDLRQFRIVKIAELENPDLEFVHGVWIVAPLRR